MVDTLPTIEYIPTDSIYPNVTCILLHGLGASNEDLYPLAKILTKGQVRMIFPNAPFRRTSINNGQRMRAWYDIEDSCFESCEDIAGFTQSLQQIDNLLITERKKNRGHHIFIGGFSQGGAIALCTGLYHRYKLDGIISLSGFLPVTNDIDNIKVNQQTPIFLSHGSDDNVVDVLFARRCFKKLRVKECLVTYQEYPIAHTISDEQIKALNDWFILQLPRQRYNFPKKEKHEYRRYD